MHSTHGSGVGTAVLVLVGAVLAVKLAGPAVAAVAGLIHLFLIVVVVIGGAGAVGLVAFITWRWRCTRIDAARTMPPLPSKVVRAAPPLPQARRAPNYPPNRSVTCRAAFIFTFTA